MDPDYELFVAIVEASSLSAAGRALAISPAMISKRLARLEARLAVQLIHRTTRRLVLTDAGHRLYNDIGIILADIQAAEDRASGQAGKIMGPLRVSAPTSFGRLHLAPYLGAFIDAHPQVALDVELSDSYDDLLSNRIDLAIRISAAPGAGLTAYALAPSERILCAAPRFLERFGAPQTLGELSRQRLLAATGQLPWRLFGPLGTKLIEGRSHVRTNSSELVRELAIAGAGIALRSLWDVNRELANGKLVRVLPSYDGGRNVAVYAVHPTMKVVRPAISAFIDFLAGIYDPSPPWAINARGSSVNPQ
jgi:DNA-binding transcriptional LysR family regulator